MGSSRKAAGESGNKAEREGHRGGGGSRRGAPRRPGELEARRLVPRGAKGDSGSYPVKDAP